MEVGSKWVSQASSIKLDNNNNDVKIKQEVNLNLAKRDEQKGSNTSEAGGSRKRFACSRCGSNRHASNDKACPALGKKCNNCSLTRHFAQYCKTKAARIDAELAKSSKIATARKNPRQCNNIQANTNDSNEETSDSSQIYSVATINKIDVKHKYMEVRLNGMPIKMLVDSGSNVTIVTAEVFNKIKFKGHKLALSAEKLMDCQSKEIPVLGEYSVEAQIGKDKFREKVLVTKLDYSFITKMKNFDWNNFLTNSSELECNQINDIKAKLEELKNEFSDIFKLKDKVMQMLHSKHMGISKTKNLARYYVWWPKIDEDIENLVKSCEPCQLNRNDPEKHSSHSWQYPSNPWERIHIDFCGPFRNHMYLIVVDAYSKWPEVIRMSSSTSTSETIKVLLSLFARHGLPDKLVSDNGPQFTSDEFKEFMLNCGILHIKTAPYHPQTNGEAERFVQTFKNFVKRADHDKNLNQRQIDEAILKFLMTYRCTPHSGTEMSPSYLMLNRQIKNVFDLLRTKTSKIEIKNLEHQDKNCKAVSEYTEGESILLRNYNSQNKWEKGIVQKKIGSLHYLIKYNNKVVKKHLDQLSPNYIKSNSTHDPSNIVSEIPCDNESLRKLINHPVSQDTSRSPVMLRRSARINKGKPPRRFYYDYSDSE